MIAKITELEKKSADDIAQTRLLYKEKIDNVRTIINEDRKLRKKEIIENNKKKKIKKFEEAKSEIDKEQSIILSEEEKLLENHNLCKRLKESVISIIFDS